MITVIAIISLYEATKYVIYVICSGNEYLFIQVLSWFSFILDCLEDFLS